VLTIYSVVMLFAYFYQSWQKLPNVPNTILYCVWMGFESMLFLAVLMLVCLAVFSVASGKRGSVLKRPGLIPANNEQPRRTDRTGL
jgi:hypothetical protein